MLARSPLRTERLMLRPSEASDAARAFEIQSDWNVTRNLRMARFPPSRADLDSWFAGQPDEWRAGTAYRFALCRGERMIGLADVDEISAGEGDLGYWLEAPVWGQGFAFEAAQALVAFAFDVVKLGALNSGHAADNVASGRVLTKLGFRHTDTVTIPSLARGGAIEQRRYRLER